MRRVESAQSCEVEPTFRLHQLLGMFDLPSERSRTHSVSAMVPDLEDAWRIGAIVGPSGSGKTTIAREAFGQETFLDPKWNPRRAIIDQLGDWPIDSLSRMLTSIGLGSVPMWLRPFHALSCGEQFRCGLVRALLNDAPLIVCDEFTNSLDRTLARNVCLSAARMLRRGDRVKRLVAVTSHRDVLRWLAPDWTLDMGDSSLHWRRLRRPKLSFAVHRCHRSLWSRFARHHYLSGELSCAAKCFAAFEKGQPIAFCAVISMLGRPEIHRVTRLVTLPDFQGLGIGGRLLDRVAQAECEEGFRVRITTSHPALVRILDRAPNWRSFGRRFVADPPRQIGHCPLRTSRGRMTATFEYLPRPIAAATAAA